MLLTRIWLNYCAPCVHTAHNITEQNFYVYIAVSLCNDVKYHCSALNFFIANSLHLFCVFQYVTKSEYDQDVP